MSITWTEQCKRSRGWASARDYYLENGTHEFAGDKAKRCLESNDIDNMDDACWTAVRGAYAHAEVDTELA